MAQFTRRTIGGLTWELPAPLCDTLLGPTGLRLGEWLDAGLATVVKHGPHRTVYRVALPGLSFYVKHCRLHDTRAWLRELVRPPKARIELQRAWAVAQHGVPTIVPLGVGVSASPLRPRESFFLSYALEGTETVRAFLESTWVNIPEPRRSWLRQRLAVALGQFLARMHDAGVVHHDLHPGNLLIRLDADDQPALFLIDLHAVSFRGPLGPRASRANLVLLNRWFTLRASPSDRLRFWLAYVKARGWKAGPTPAWRDEANKLEQLTWRSNLRFWRSRDERCLVTNRYYRRVRSAGTVGYVVSDLDEAIAQQLTADPDAPFRQPAIRRLKQSRSSTVVEFDVCVAGSWKPAVYKRFQVTAWSDPWVALLRRPAALRSWVFGHGLRDRALPTPRPLAVWYRRRWGLWREGYLLCEKVPSARHLGTFLDELARHGEAERRRVVRRLVDQLGRLVRDLHRRQLSQRDLKASNILVQERAGGDQLALWLIDLVGIRRYGNLPRNRRVQNLARLHASFVHHPFVSRTDKLRFLRAYLQWGLRGRAGWKWWWRQIEAATLAKLAKNARSGRPVS
ncbi:MAG: lipopolysaccharide kinase InaA family protein [Gemmataceae bacterium]|nr:lipopolysaccharide kinase InaA family protein [Gemmataceae bacterium]